MIMKNERGKNIVVAIVGNKIISAVIYNCSTQSTMNLRS